MGTSTPTAAPAQRGAPEERHAADPYYPQAPSMHPMPPSLQDKQHGFSGHAALPGRATRPTGMADAWPLLSVSHNRQPSTLLIAARHHAGRIDVFGINLQKYVRSASITLWWWSLTRHLLPAEQSCLEAHLSGSCLSYSACMELMLDWAAGATEAQRHDIVRAAAQQWTPFGDATVRSMDFGSLLETLALIRHIKPVTLRVPLHHWLSTWAAQHTGHPLRCPLP